MKTLCLLLLVFFVWVTPSFGACDAVVSPDGTAIIVTGTTATNFDIMADAQVVAKFTTPGIRIRVKIICWSNAEDEGADITAADRLEIQDADGNLFCPVFVAINNNDSFCTREINRPISAGSILVNDMDSGTLILQLETY